MSRRWRDRLRFSLVMLIVTAVINVGCYVWLDNAVAIVPDNDPATGVNIELYDDFNHGHGDPSDDVVTPGDQDNGGGKAQKVIRGNGDRDDNRTRSYSYCRASSGAVRFQTTKFSSSFNERYTTVAYKDFGHLKVMPAGNDIAGTISSPFDRCERPPVYCGRPFFIRYFVNFIRLYG